MSIYSTRELTRAEAISMFYAYRDKTPERMTDVELEDALFGMYGEDTLNNYLIVKEEN